MAMQPVTLPRDLTGRTVVAAIFADRANAERAIDALRGAGYTGDQIGVAMRDFSADDAWVAETSNQAVDGAVGGAVGGGLMGGVAGFLVGLVAALALPGIGPIVAGGTLAAALGAASGTAVAGAALGAAGGGVMGALTHLGLPEHEVEHFESAFRAGGVLLTVNAGERAAEALQLLEQYGGDPGPIQAVVDANRSAGHVS